jgi:hypothetical protein
MSVTFRDRPLKAGEHSHYVCDQCGAELHPDMAYSHNCAIVSNIKWHGWDNPMQNQYFNKLW